VNASQVIKGSIHLKANDKYSYDAQIQVQIEGTAIETLSEVRLQDQVYHYLQSSQAASTGVYDGISRDNNM